MIFFFIDSRNKSGNHVNQSVSGKIKISGVQNFIWLLLLIVTVFLNPDQLPQLPTLYGHSFIREILQILIAFLCFKTSNRQALQLNKFQFEPIKEVGFLFFGIFFSMIPALDLLEKNVENLATVISPSLFFWGSGISSSVLDNAPAYLSFLSTAMSSFGLSIDDPAAVAAFSLNEKTSMYLKAITLGASLFGALTYIGNGPNFMVKAMCEEQGIEIPTFFGFILKYSIPLLLPVLIMVWFLFIR